MRSRPTSLDGSSPVSTSTAPGITEVAQPAACPRAHLPDRSRWHLARFARDARPEVTLAPPAERFGEPGGVPAAARWCLEGDGREGRELQALPHGGWRSDDGCARASRRRGGERKVGKPQMAASTCSSVSSLRVVRQLKVIAREQWAPGPGRRARERPPSADATRGGRERSLGAAPDLLASGTGTGGGVTAVRLGASRPPPSPPPQGACGPSSRPGSGCPHPPPGTPSPLDTARVSVPSLSGNALTTVR